MLQLDLAWRRRVQALAKMLVSDRGGRQHRTDHKVVGGRGRNVEEYLNARENGVRFCLSKADLEPNFRAETQVSSV